MDCIPRDSLHASDGRFVQTFNAESCDLIKDCSPVLESIVRVAVIEKNVFRQIPHRYGRHFPHEVVQKPWRMMLPAGPFPDRPHRLATIGDRSTDGILLVTIGLASARSDFDSRQSNETFVPCRSTGGYDTVNLYFQFFRRLGSSHSALYLLR